MSKLQKDDFDEYFGKESFYSNEDKTRFFEKLNTHNRKKAYLFPKLITGIVAVGLLFFIVQISVYKSDLNNGQIGETNKEWETVHSIEEVQKYYEQKTPGLKRAEELGLVTNVDQVIEINDEYNLHMDKIWYNSNHIFYFYSIGRKDGGTIPLGESGPTITGLNFEDSESASEYDIPFYTLGMGPYEGIVYKNRFYHRATSQPFGDDNGDPFDVFNQEFLASFNIDLLGKRAKTNPLILPFEFNNKKETVYEIPIHHQIIEEDFTLTYNKLDLGVAENKLYGVVENKNGLKALQLEGVIETDKGETQPLFGSSQDGEGNFDIEFGSFNYMPEEVKLKIDHVQFISDKSISFQINLEKYDEFLNTPSDFKELVVEKKIAEIMNTDIYLDRLYFKETGMEFMVRYIPKSENQQVKLVGNTPSIEDEKDWEFANTIITVRNEKDEPGMYGQRGSSSNYFTLELEKEFLKESKVLDITVDHLLFQEPVTQSITYPIQ